MALLEYVNRTVPEVIKDYEQSFYHDDPLMNDIERKNKVVKSGGTNVRFTRVLSGHSDIYPIDSSNHSVPAVKKATLGTMTGDWGWYSKPVTISHYDRNRLQSPDEKKRFVDEMVGACMLDFKNQIQRQVYLGNNTSLLNVGTLNGAATGLTATGFESGALQFLAPGSQSGTYLGVTRAIDTTNLVDNWHNQFADAAPGTDMLAKMSTLKRKADSYADEGKCDMVIVGFTTYEALEDEILAFQGSGQELIKYTPDDVAKGKVVPPVEVVRGMRIYTNRWMDSLDAAASVVTPAYGLNSSKIELWINAGNHFKFSGMKDLSPIGQKVDFGTVDLEMQFVVRNLLCQFACENV